MFRRESIKRVVILDDDVLMIKKNPDAKSEKKFE